MATTEVDTLLTHVDGAGNKTLVYPITNVRNVVGAAAADTYMLRLTAEEYEGRTLTQRQQDYADGVRGYLVEGGLDVDSLTDMQKFAAFAHPVGEIVQFDVPTSPATLWGFGTWESLAEGRVLIGAGTADSGTVYTAGQTGGEEKVSLTSDQNGKHTHSEIMVNEFYKLKYSSAGYDGTGGSAKLYAAAHNGGTENDVYTNSSGSGAPHNNMQPYYVCYIWRRVA